MQCPRDSRLLLNALFVHVWQYVAPWEVSTAHALPLIICVMTRIADRVIERSVCHANF